MGVGYEASCTDCGHRFTVMEGGGFELLFMYCSRCGDTLEIDMENPPPEWDPSTSSAGVHEGCGGRFTEDPVLRCPKCRSRKCDPDRDGGFLWD
ncbi:hypothetical protein ACFL59_03015 [Planctomycetota bacterium]